MSKGEYAGEYKPGKTGRRVSSFFVTLIIIGLACMFYLFLRNQYGTLAAVERSIAAVRHDINEQSAVRQALLHEKAMHGSAEYYEKIARERLGLVYRNEIHFRRR